MTRSGPTDKRFAVALACAGAALMIAGAPAGAAERGGAISVTIQKPEEASRYRTVFSEAQIREWLGEFASGECDPATVAESLGRRYRFLGYVPTIKVSCEGADLAVSIRESSHRIVLIAFDPDDLARLDISPDTDVEERVTFYPVPTGSIRVVLRGLLQTREGDLYNHERYRSDSDALRRLGYAVAFVRGAAADEVAYPQAAYLIQSLRPHRLDEVKGPTRKNSYLGGTGSFAPRAGTAAGLVFQQNGVFGDFDRLSVAPSFNASFGADLSYSTPLLAASSAPKRLYDLGGSVYTYFTHNRIIDEQATDERRSGGSVNLGLRPLGLGAPHDLRWQVGVRHESVSISEPSLRTNDENLTFLQLAASYEWRHTFRSPSLSLHLAPVFDFSLAAAGGQRSFVRPGLDGTLHARYRSGVEFDVHLSGGTLDRGVPPVELWTLGGPTTVRGFREDSYLGRHIMAGQSEVWFPLFRTLAARAIVPGDPLPEPGEEAHERPSARLLKAAIFVDGGAIGGAPDGRDVAILGAGVGLRFVVPRQPLVLRLDYGWGLGGEGGRSYPYLSMGYRF